MYDKAGPVIQGFAGTFARKKIYDLEKQMFENGATKEQAQSIRPEKGQDPAIRMMQIMLSGLKDMLQYVELEFSYNDNGEITDFSYQFKDKSQAG